MHTSYWKEFGGELFAPYSAASFFKALTDVINNEHWSLDNLSADFLRPYAEAVDAVLPIEVLERIKSVTFLNVRRQHLWDQSGDLNNGGFLAHRNPKESEDEPETLTADGPDTPLHRTPIGLKSFVDVQGVYIFLV